MPDYIEREALIQDAEDVLTFQMLDRINRQPAADVAQVVHCGECEHYGCGPFGKGCNTMFDGKCAVIPKNPDDFCSYGKRKEATQCTTN